MLLLNMVFILPGQHGDPHSQHWHESGHEGRRHPDPGRGDHRRLVRARHVDGTCVLALGDTKQKRKA